MTFLKPERDAKIPKKPNAAAMNKQPLITAPSPEEVETPSFPLVVS